MAAYLFGTVALGIALIVLGAVVVMAILGVFGGTAAATCTARNSRMEFRQDVRSGVEQAIHDIDRQDNGWFS